MGGGKDGYDWEGAGGASRVVVWACGIVFSSGSGDACRDMNGQFIVDFDAELRSTFEEIVGLGLSDEQWNQAS
eukprot:70590-Karenia_brevis.AAC.1